MQEFFLKAFMPPWKASLVYKTFSGLHARILSTKLFRPPLQKDFFTMHETFSSFCHKTLQPALMQTRDGWWVRAPSRPMPCMTFGCLHVHEEQLASTPNQSHRALSSVMHRRIHLIKTNAIARCR